MITAEPVVRNELVDLLRERGVNAEAFTRDGIAVKGRNSVFYSISTGGYRLYGASGSFLYKGDIEPSLPVIEKARRLEELAK